MNPTMRYLFYHYFRGLSPYSQLQNTLKLSSRHAWSSNGPHKTDSSKIRLYLRSKNNKLLHLGLMWNSLEVIHKAGHVAASIVDGRAGTQHRELDYIKGWRKNLCVKLMLRLERPEVSLCKHSNVFSDIWISRGPIKANRWITAIEACKYYSFKEELADTWKRPWYNFSLSHMP